MPHTSNLTCITRCRVTAYLKLSRNAFIIPWHVFTTHLIVHHLLVWTSFCVYGWIQFLNFVWCLFNVFIMIHVLYAMHFHKEKRIFINVVSFVKILVFNNNFSHYFLSFFFIRNVRPILIGVEVSFVLLIKFR